MGRSSRNDDGASELPFKENEYYSWKGFYFYVLICLILVIKLKKKMNFLQ